MFGFYSFGYFLGVVGELEGGEVTDVERFASTRRLKRSIEGIRRLTKTVLTVLDENKVLQERNQEMFETLQFGQHHLVDSAIAFMNRQVRLEVEILELHNSLERIRSLALEGLPYGVGTMKWDPMGNEQEALVGILQVVSAVADLGSLENHQTAEEVDV